MAGTVITTTELLVSLFYGHLSKFGGVRLFVDAAVKGVDLPPQVIASRHVILDYALDFPIPILDLVANEKGVSGVLSFAQTPTQTFVPWAAVDAMEPMPRAVASEPKARHLSLVP